jgi:hypothetical protein
MDSRDGAWRYSPSLRTDARSQRWSRQLASLESVCRSMTSILDAHGIDRPPSPAPDRRPAALTVRRATRHWEGCDAMQRYKFAPVLGPANDKPIGSFQRAECWGNELKFLVESIEKSVDHLVASIIAHRLS